MNNAISPNPSVPAENAVCQEAPNRWTAAAWALGRRLLRGPVRTRNGRADDRLVSDLVRMGMVERRGGGWLRITDAGRAAFPNNRCARWRPFGRVAWYDLDVQRSRACKAFAPHVGKKLDELVRKLADEYASNRAAAEQSSDGPLDSAYFDGLPVEEPLTPGEVLLQFDREGHGRAAGGHVARAGARAPEQIVRGRTTNVADRIDMKVGAPTLDDLLNLAPMRDRSETDPGYGWWPDVGATDKFPAARVGYPTGPKVERQYA